MWLCIYIYARWSVYIYIHTYSLRDVAVYIYMRDCLYIYIYSLRDVAVYLYARWVRDAEFEGFLLYDIYHFNYINITETYNR